MDELSFIRHGPKIPIGSENLHLEKSGLSLEQQEKWKAAQESLGEGSDTEITYETLPKIEKMAEEIYDKLPEKALLLFTATDTPRTKMTANLLSMEMIRLTEKGEKDI